MKTYSKAEVSEQRLEDLVRRHCGLIEDGLVYVDHQRPAAAGGRLDVLLVDSGHSMVVAELKIIEDDGMLVQGLDYYDYVSSHVESYARLYSKVCSIDPNQKVRLFLIAPDFSQTLVSRCRWLDLPISLFTFTCLKFEGEDDLVPIFTEREIPSPPEVVELPPSKTDLLGYITDTTVRANVDSLLKEVEAWKPEYITLDSTQGAISMKVKNRVFAYLWPRRKHYVIGTFGTDDQWKEQPVKTGDDLERLKLAMKASFEKKAG